MNVEAEAIKGSKKFDLEKMKTSEFSKKIKKNFGKNWDLYLMLVPIIIYFIVFWLIPLYGIIIAFKNYSISTGIFESPWVGFRHFSRFFKSFYLTRTIKNTIGLNLYGLLAGFPLTIILALMFNELRNKKFKNLAQIISYAPNFISVVVVVGMLTTFLSPSTGFISQFIETITGKSINLMENENYFWHLYTWSGIWQGIGFGTILYTAAMSSISSDLYEAADIEGATKLQKMRYITLPSISGLIVLMFILALGNLFSLGFDKILLMQRSTNLVASEVISTYVYKQGILGGQFSYTTAISLFNTVANITVLSIASCVSKKIRGRGLFE